MTNPDIGTGQLRITLFGPMAVHVDGVPLSTLRNRRGLWLLALLTLRPNREVSRIWLAGMLWPDSADTVALGNLRRILTELRRALGAASARLECPTSQTLLLKLSHDDADVLAFDRIANEKEPTVFAMEQAAALYRSPLMEDCYESWAIQEQQARRESYLNLLVRLAALKRAGGAYSEAVRYLRLAVSCDPLRESLVSQLMQSLADSGDTIAAGEVYRQLRTALGREMHAEPSADLRALDKQLRSEARREHRGSLRSLEKTAGDTKPVLPHRGSLPSALTPLIGREAELREIAAQLESSRLMTLTGVGGIGKTRLSIQVGYDWLGKADDGVWFVELAALQDPNALVRVTAGVLGLRETPASAPIESLVTHLRSRSGLLILDNCEHLLQGCAEFAARLLADCPDLQILATSRQPLGITGERVWRVPSLKLVPLSVLQSRTRECLLEPLRREYASVDLFVTRALSVHPAIIVSPAGLQAIVEICNRLDGIPLALELAAARVKSLSLEQIAARLTDRFHLLTGGSRDALPRQQTLRALVDWSYDLLPMREQVLFRRLSVFAGSFPLKAAEGICSDTGGDPEAIRPEARAAVPRVEAREAMDLLAELVDKSLVISEDDLEGERWYRMLETIRHYGAEKLETAGEVATVSERHMAWYLGFLEPSEAGLRGPDQGRWMKRLEREHDNLRQCLIVSRSVPAGGEELRFCALLGWFWYIAGHWSEGRENLDLALSREEASAPTTMRKKTLQSAGLIAYEQGDYAAARRYHEESLEVSEQMGDQRGIATSLTNLSYIHVLMNDPATAQALLERALRINREVGSKLDETSTLNTLGMIAVKMGKFEDAMRYYEMCLEISRHQGNIRFIASALNNLGLVEGHLGHTDAAAGHFEEALQINRSAGYEVYITVNLNNLGSVALDRKEYERAHLLLTESLALAHRLNNKPRTMEAMTILARLAKQRAFLHKSTILYSAVTHLFEQFGLPPNPEERAICDQDLAALRGVLGENAYEADCAKGHGMSWEEAVAFAGCEGDVS